MFRIIAGYVLKAAVVAVPLLLPLVVRLGLSGVDERTLGAVVSLALLSLIFAVDVVEHAIPRARAHKFREEYLAEIVKERFKGSGKHLRFNVMIARRSWHSLWLFRTFHWVASRGFVPGQHHDAKLRLAEWQGVCGEAFRTERAVLADFRGVAPARPSLLPWRNAYWLLPWQVTKTRNVLVIASVPLLVKQGTGGNPHYTAVGVLNIDAMTPPSAEWLVDNWERMRKPLLETGSFLAALG